MRALIALSFAGMLACGNSGRLATPTVSGLVANSERAYDVVTLTEGERVYTDRNYTIRHVPHELRGASLIRTPNNDKRSPLDALVRFQVSADADVIVAYDARAKTLPTWLKAFEPYRGALETNDVNKRLYRKRFDKGASVVLGGNLHGEAHGAESNFNVIVVAPR